MAKSFSISWKNQQVFLCFALQLLTAAQAGGVLTMASLLLMEDVCPILPSPDAHQELKKFQHSTPGGSSLEMIENMTPSASNDGECTLYLAKSSIPGAGVGIYTTVPLTKGQIFGEPELVVPLPDFLSSEKGYLLMEDVIWGPDIYDDFSMESLGTTEIFYPGFGAAVNCHLGLNNIFHDSPTPDSAGLHRAGDPGVGAFTNYHGVPNRATKDIEAGSELFVDYGEEWFVTREATVGYVPLSKDYIAANRIMQVLLNESPNSFTGNNNINATFQSRADSGKPEKEVEVWENKWQFIRDSADDRLRAALPISVTELERASLIGSESYGLLPQEDDEVIHRNDGSLSRHLRSTTWLKKNGGCVDNIRPSKSTIKQAGRGAFAKRSIGQGDIVSPVPVLPIWRKSLTTFETSLRDYTWNNGEKVFAVDSEKKHEQEEEVIFGESVGMQLLLNYCYGHSNSSVVLLPYAPLVNHINHNGAVRANVKLRWSTTPGLNRDDWLVLPLREMVQKKFGLVMELVAIRDISEGEEIFLDYGREWEKAWEEHLQEWRQNDMSDEVDYVSAAEVRARGEKARILTEAEQLVTPYPSNLQTACYYMPSREVKNSFKYDPDHEVGSGDNKGNPKTIEIKWNQKKHNYCLRPCRILSRYSANGEDSQKMRFKAEMMNALNHPKYCDIPEGERHVIQDIPRSAVSFLDKPYTKDQYMKNAFRHEIVLEDDVFPNSWKDLV